MLEKKIDFAVIGMACRFPGAENYAQYWENLIQGKNCVAEIPKDRWDWQAYFGDPRTDTNKTNIKWGGFIDDIDKFDPLFFNISPKEAAYIDPQHRLFLQTAWHCIEDAGYSVESLAGRKIGIYAGVSKNDYSEMMRESRNEIAPFISTGTVHSILTNRLSFLFDFHGRSEPVDTACSSSLVALHNAMRDISCGECEAALVGGVNALLAPTMFISHSKSGMLSIDGQCKTFDSEANGYVRGEGAGILFIKPLTKAIEAGDFIHAVIKGSAINHGGRANFLTSPTVEAQSEVIGTALENADVDPGTITYIEAHGTGTPLGDPIEINALKKAFKSKQGISQKSAPRSTEFCALSSVKTNIGHLESASGIAGIIKAILAMQHKKIPALRNFKKLNPYIDLEQSPFYIADRNIEWEALLADNGKTIPRRAGVSSFGMGGVNAHVILEEAPVKKAVRLTTDEEETPQLILISSKKKEGLKEQAGNLLQYLSALNAPGQNMGDRAPRLQDIAYTHQVGRDQFTERLTLIVSSKAELIRQLADYIKNGVSNTSCFIGSVVIKKGERPSIIKVNAEMSLESLAEKWTQGAKLDWTEFYSNNNSASRIPLPVYAFMKKRCWFNQESVAPVKTPEKNPIAISAPKSDFKMAEIVFNKTLHPNDFYIRDHCVQDEKLLPGVAYLEIARAAYDQVAGNQNANTIQHVYWINPVILKDEDLPIHVKLSNNTTRQPEQSSFSNFQVLHHKFLHSRGEIGHTNLSALDLVPINIPVIKKACSREILQQDIYQRFIPYGLNYGPSFQPLQRCFYNSQAIFSELKIPQVLAQTLDDFVLHPSIMDGVFQTIVALSIFGSDRKDEQYVPFYLERIEIIKPIPAHCYAYAKKRDNNNPNVNEIVFDAVICNETGELLVNITGLTKRALHLKPHQDIQQLQTGNIQSQVSKKKKTDIYYCSEWRNTEIQLQPESLDHLIVFGNDNHLLQQNTWSHSSVNGPVYLVTPGSNYQIINSNHIQIDPANFDDYLKMIQYLKDEKCAINNILYLWNFDSEPSNSIDPIENGIISLLRLTKAIISRKASKNVKLLYCYPNETKSSQPYHALIGGFARTLIYENPNMRFLSAGIDSAAPEEIIQLAQREFASERHDKLLEIRHESGKRLTRKIVNFTPPDLHLHGSETVLRKNGVYLITGGAGGLGFIFARYLSEKYHATTLLIGRSKLNAQIQEKIAAIASLGGQCTYYSADITQADALQKTFLEIKNTYPHIHGVIHAAGVIEDAYILLKKEDSFRRVIHTKVNGLLNLDTATRHENLDFVCLFSSIAALMPNQGQSDYASANSFLDSYAALRNRLRDENKRSGFTLAINWPLWAQGGMRVTPEEEAHLLHEFGMAPLEEKSGLEIFEQGLKFASCYGHSHGLSHIVAIDGDKSKIAHCLGIENQQNTQSDITIQHEINQTGLEMNGIANNDIENEVKNKFSELFDIAAEKIDGEISMSELGLDSGSMVSIIQHINTRFEINLKPTVFFELDTIDQFVRFIDSHCQSKKGLPPSRHNTSLIDVNQSNPSEKQFQRTFNVAEFYLEDHVVEGQYNMPGACYIEMARQAGDLLLGDKAVIKLTNNYWVRQLSSPEKDFTAYINILPKSSGYDYEVISYNDSREKIVHAIGTLVNRENNAATSIAPDYLDLNAVRSRCTAVQQPDQVYRQIIAEGLHVGPTFKPMQQILLSKGEALSILALPDSIEDTVDDYVLHPTMLTGVFQTALISNRFNEENQQAHFIPMGIDELEIFAPVTSRCLVYSKSTKSNDNLKKFDLLVCREDGLVAARLKGFAIRALKNVEKKDNDKNNYPEQTSITSDQSSKQLAQASYRFIKNLLSPHIGLSVEEIDNDESFDAYGINSIMIVELNKSFEDTFGPLSKTLFFEYRNVQELAEYFIENHAEKLAQPTSENDQTFIPEPDIQPVETPPGNITAASNTDQGTAELYKSATHAIKQLLSPHIGLAVDEIEASEDFEAYGINSVMIVELNRAFEAVFGSLSKTLFFEYRNIEELVEYFAENHLTRLQDLFDLNTSVNSTDSTKTNKEDDRIRSEAVPDTDRKKDSFVPKNIHNNSAISAQPAESVHLNEDIAIIGIDGRYPHANNVNEFWEVLKKGTDCITDIPESHFDFRPIFDSDPENNKIYSKRGAFLNDIDKFDAAFFNISPREAELIDPQERLFLEVAWGAMEDAGYTRQALLDSSDRQVGVFVGALWQPYQAIGTEETLKGNIVAPSGLLYSIANRVSYFMNFSGPSLAIDTACSSSLTAVHFACQSLHNGDCKVAIAGGVNLSLHSSKYLFLSQNRFLSTDGRCRSFGDGGDGYVPGEGVGAIILKPLSEAIKDGDAVYAVIKGSSVNHGGKTNGYTVPCPNAQSDIIKTVFRKSGINPRTVSYIEAHGTGTPLGDPIEITGLRKAFEVSTKDKQFCAIGSVKSNIGHLEAAAGIASITKVILQMKNRQLAPSIHSDTLNSNIDFTQTPFKVQHGLSVWTQPELITDGISETYPRRAGISSFGAGGSNAHILLEEFDARKTETANVQPDAANMIVLSAKNENRLREMAAHLLHFLDQNLLTDSLSDLAYTLQTGREAMNERLGIIAGSVAELQNALGAYLNKDTAKNIYTGNIANHKDILSIFGSDEDIGSIIEAWIARKKYGKLLDIWVKGFKINWNLLYQSDKPRRIHLPTYPFAKESYWISTGQVEKIIGEHQGASKLHPLIHENRSTLSTQRFNSIFTGEEFFLKDHIVGDTKVLPAVAYIEMFRSAAALSTEELKPLKLYNLAWLEPITQESRQLQVSTELLVEDDEFYLQACTEKNGKTTVHGYGQCLYLDPSMNHLQLERNSSIPIDEIESSLQNQIDSDQIYALFHKKGLNLQDGFQGINWIKWNGVQALGKITLPASLNSQERNHYHIHPSLLDSALQTALYILETTHQKEGALFLPYSIEEVEIYATLPDTLYSLVQPSDNKALHESHHSVRSFNVTIVDQSGVILMKVKNFSFRETNLSTGQIQKLSGHVHGAVNAITYSSPAWVETAINKNSSKSSVENATGFIVVSNNADQLEQFCATLNRINNNHPVYEIILSDKKHPEKPGRLYLNTLEQNANAQLAVFLNDVKNDISHIVCLQDSTSQKEPNTLCFQTQQSIVALFDINKHCLSSSKTIRQLFVNICKKDTSQQVLEGGINGFFNSVQTEYTKSVNSVISIQLNKMDSIELSAWIDPVINELRVSDDNAGNWIRYSENGQRRSEWQLHPLKDINMPRKSANFDFSAIKAGGTYLITGGMGGIGKILVRYLAQNYNVNLVLIGRSSLDSDDDAFIKSIRHATEDALYLQADITDSDSLERVITKAKQQYGVINGVIHCAGVLEDNLLINKNTQSLKKVLQPKLQGTINLDQSTFSEPLDFFLVFSSLTSLLGNPGQCDYGAANGFMDAFMAYRQTLVEKQLRQGLSLTVNWPLWKDGKMGQSADVSDMLDDSFGAPLAAAEGMKCFEQIFHLGQNQIAVVKNEKATADPLMTQKKQIHENDSSQNPLAITSSAADIASDLQIDTKNMIAELGKFSPEQISLQNDFMALGLESVILAKLASRLNKQFSLKISPAIFFEHTNLEKLIAYLLDEHKTNIYAYYERAKPVNLQATDISREIPNTLKIVSSDINRQANSSVHRAESEISAENLDEMLRDDITQIIVDLGKFKPGQVVADVDFISLGLDSVILAKLSSQLNKKFSIKISPAIFFEHTSLEKLNIHLLEQFRPELTHFYEKNRHTDESIERSEVKPAGIRQANKIKHVLEQQETEIKRLHSIEKNESSSVHVQSSPATDIAVIGMDCVFPGAPDLESFWQLLIDCQSTVSEIPVNRWDWKTFFGDPNKETHKTNIKWGHFVDDLDKFDPAFFNISPREAALMDPQQRLLLQSVWKSIEHAGYAPMDLSKNSKVGFFTGISGNDYYELLMNSDIEAYSSTGGVHSIAANRVSYFFDFKGPSIPVDTACSSSLVALDMAVKSLEHGNCDVAITGGVNALISPTLYIAFSKAGMLSPDGNLSPLDKKANGYVRGEGVGTLVLKRLDKAIKDQDTIHAVIKGTSVNHGGKVPSLTVPNPRAQSELILDACSKAKIDVTTLNYVELHGTGTPLGDPIEVNGLKNAFKSGQAIQQEGYCGIASVKGNIGHLEAAAGVAGVIKTILALKNKVLPGQCHFEELNPHIHLENTPFKVVQNAEHWPNLMDKNGASLPRRAGVSSFGFGGANAHVVIEEYLAEHADKPLPKPDENTNGNKSYPIVLSAKTKERLVALAHQLSMYLENQMDECFDLQRIAYTLQTGRTAFEHRLGLLAKNRKELLLLLKAYINGDTNHEHMYVGEIDMNSTAQLPAADVSELDLNNWLQNQNYERVLICWVKGRFVEWNRLYNENHRPQRCDLPTYPFAKERYWIADSLKSKSIYTINEAEAVAQQSPDKQDSSKMKLSPNSLREQCIGYLKQLAASVLQMPLEKIDSARSLEAYGMDSILIMQTITILNRSFPNITSTLLTEYRTIDALADYLITNHKNLLIELLDLDNQEPGQIDQAEKLLSTGLEIAADSQQHHSVLPENISQEEESSLSIGDIANALSLNKIDFDTALQIVKQSAAMR
ncbi:MAG: SDR family NAD(P)-dependent oxidoreductase [Burkholderiales bacterium]|nr:SDR family NAD(P)-dependent oxidoreductase [Burkholderiales bacterium]MDR4516868.1 SDR family NAD(P)-dependent oxidoreductase [Nitrosomonas sp.]